VFYTEPLLSWQLAIQVLFSVLLGDLVGAAEELQNQLLSFLQGELHHFLEEEVDPLTLKIWIPYCFLMKSVPAAHHNRNNTIGCTNEHSMDPMVEALEASLALSFVGRKEAAQVGLYQAVEEAEPFFIVGRYRVILAE